MTQRRRIGFEVGDTVGGGGGALSTTSTALVPLPSPASSAVVAVAPPSTTAVDNLLSNWDDDLTSPAPPPQPPTSSTSNRSLNSPQFNSLPTYSPSRSPFTSSHSSLPPPSSRPNPHPSRSSLRPQTPFHHPSSSPSSSDLSTRLRSTGLFERGSEAEELLRGLDGWSGSGSGRRSFESDDPWMERRGLGDGMGMGRRGGEREVSAKWQDGVRRRNGDYEVRLLFSLSNYLLFFFFSLFTSGTYLPQTNLVRSSQITNSSYSARQSQDGTFSWSTSEISVSYTSVRLFPPFDLSLPPRVDLLSRAHRAILSHLLQTVDLFDLLLPTFVLRTHTLNNNNIIKLSPPPHLSFLLSLSLSLRRLRIVLTSAEVHPLK